MSKKALKKVIGKIDNAVKGYLEDSSVDIFEFGGVLFNYLFSKDMDFLSREEYGLTKTYSSLLMSLLEFRDIDEQTKKFINNKDFQFAEEILYKKEKDWIFNEMNEGGLLNDLSTDKIDSLDDKEYIRVCCRLVNLINSSVDDDSLSLEDSDRLYSLLEEIIKLDEDRFKEFGLKVRPKENRDWIELEKTGFPVKDLEFLNRESIKILSDAIREFPNATVLDFLRKDLEYLKANSKSCIITPDESNPNGDEIFKELCLKYMIEHDSPIFWNEVCQKGYAIFYK